MIVLMLVFVLSFLGVCYVGRWYKEEATYWKEKYEELARSQVRERDSRGRFVKKH